MPGHHRFLLAEYLGEWDALEERIRRVESEIDAHILPFESGVTLRETLPGVDRVTACSLIAEIGVDIAVSDGAAPGIMGGAVPG